MDAKNSARTLRMARARAQQFILLFRRPFLFDERVVFEPTIVASSRLVRNWRLES